MNETSESSRARSVDLSFTVAIFIFLAVIFVLSFSLSKTARSVPLLISATGMLLCAINLMVRPKNGPGKDAKQEESQTAEQTTLGFLPCMGVIVAYFVGMVLLGFVLSTFLMLVFLPALLGYRKYRTNILFSAITTAVLYVSFVKFFYVRLPMGLIVAYFAKAV